MEDEKKEVAKIKCPYCNGNLNDVSSDNDVMKRVIANATGGKQGFTFKCDLCPVEISILEFSRSNALSHLAFRADREQKQAIDILLFCPNCAEQHIDGVEPDMCQDCGHLNKEHFNAGERNVCAGGEWNGDLHDENGCKCEGFVAWLNPPHKSHRCHECNQVWRPADIPTNGVQQIQSKGENDGNARPRYFKTAKDFNDALSTLRADSEGWKPINSDDDLPKNSDYYLVSDVDEDVWICDFSGELEQWLGIDGEVMNDRILAYRPLPAPFAAASAETLEEGK